MCNPNIEIESSDISVSHKGGGGEGPVQAWRRGLERGVEGVGVEWRGRGGAEGVGVVGRAHLKLGLAAQARS